MALCAERLQVPELVRGTAVDQLDPMIDVRGGPAASPAGVAITLKDGLSNPPPLRRRPGIGLESRGDLTGAEGTGADHDRLVLRIARDRQSSLVTSGHDSARLTTGERHVI